MPIPNQQLTIPQWLELPQAVKHKLITVFKIPKSQGCSIVNNSVVSDGHTHKDLAVVSILAMQTFLGKEDEKDFWTLLTATVECVENLVDAELEARMKQAEDDHETLFAAKAEAMADLSKRMEELATDIVEPVKRKPGRPAKQVV